MPKACIHWFRLLRVPNLFTAPGDSLGGLFLTALLMRRTPAPATIALLAATSVLAYAFGILTNDLCDYREDKILRPERPLPAGQISLRAALAAAALAALGTLLCAGLATAGNFLPGIVLLMAILLYNGGLKRFRYLGSLAMGLCRGLNVWLGVACLNPTAEILPVALLPAVAVTVTIAAVTLLADRENQVQTPGRLVFLPAFVNLAAWLALTPWFPYPYVLTNGAFNASFVLLFLSAGLNFMNALSLFGHEIPPGVMQPAIGQFIRNLIPWQMSWIVIHGSATAWLTTGIVVLAFAAARVLARKFPQS